MTVTASPAFVQNPKITPITIVNATGTGKVTVATAGSNGSKVTGLWLTNTDTVQYEIQVFLTRSSTSYLLGTVPLPGNAGNDGVNQTVDLLNNILMVGIPVDSDGQRYIFLENGDTLQLASTTTVTTAKTVTAACLMGNF